jgi:cardiolipin synthase
MALEWASVIAAAALLIHVIGLALAMDAVMIGRTAQGTLGWVVALIGLPYLAIPVYVLFGSRKFYGYLRARRSGNADLDRVAGSLARNLRAAALAIGAGSWDDHGLGRLGIMPATTGNRVDLLIDGPQTFDAIFAALDRAARYVLVQFYIIRDDGLGRRLQERLLAARRRGVRVHVLYDTIGSHALPRQYERALRDAGCEVHGFCPSRRFASRNRFHLNFRNHRKIVVVDGREAFLGGHNVGDEYLGTAAGLPPWRDTHVRLRGPSVQAVQLAFLEDWFWASGNVPDLEWTPTPAVPDPDEPPDSCRGDSGEGQRVLIVPSGPPDEVETCALMFLELIHSARRRLWIATPYFVPDEQIISALQLAAFRGVDVRIIIPDRPDLLLVRYSAYSYYPDVLPHGVKLYRYMPGFMHQKVTLADRTAAVGTANLDNRSFRINFEITAVVIDDEFAARVEAMFHRDFERCHRVSQHEFDRRSWGFRLLARLSRLLAPIQ